MVGGFIGCVRELASRDRRTRGARGWLRRGRAVAGARTRWPRDPRLGHLGRGDRGGTPARRSGRARGRLPRGADRGARSPPRTPPSWSSAARSSSTCPTPRRGSRRSRRWPGRGCWSACRASRSGGSLNLARFKYVSRPRQHPRTPQPLVAAAVPRVRRRAGRDRRDAQPAAVDDGARAGCGHERLGATGAWMRRHAAVLAIACVGFGWAFVIHTMGWAQLAHFSEVRALSHGEKTIDRWHWETGDVAYIDGHYYSVKSPGMAALSVPLYKLIVAARRRGRVARRRRQRRAVLPPALGPQRGRRPGRSTATTRARARDDGDADRGRDHRSSGR